eukprot:s1245_g11.t3
MGFFDVLQVLEITDEFYGQIIIASYGLAALHFWTQRGLRMTSGVLAECDFYLRLLRKFMGVEQGLTEEAQKRVHERRRVSLQEIASLWSLVLDLFVLTLFVFQATGMSPPMINGKCFFVTVSIGSTVMRRMGDPDVELTPERLNRDMTIMSLLVFGATLGMPRELMPACYMARMLCFTFTNSQISNKVNIFLAPFYVISHWLNEQPNAPVERLLFSLIGEMVAVALMILVVTNLDTKERHAAVATLELEAKVKEVQEAEQEGGAAQRLLSVTCDAFVRLTHDLKIKTPSRSLLDMLMCHFGSNNANTLDGMLFSRYIAPQDQQRFTDFIAESSQANAPARSLHVDMKAGGLVVEEFGGLSWTLTPDRCRRKGVGGDHNVERFEIGSERGSNGSWSGESQRDWSSNASWWSRDYENWSWDGRSSGWSGNYGQFYANWEWVRPRDPWRDWHREGERRGDLQGVSHEHDSGVLHRVDHGQGRCEEPGSPLSPPAARDVSGALPSGEVSSAGQANEPKVAGDQKHSKISSSYPPVFRAKPGESFREWKRAVGFWLGGEAGSLPAELIGPRLMVQLRDRAGQLVHHLSNEDVNKPGGMDVVMQTLEKSPLIRQLDKHKIDLHRKRLMSLKRLPQESIESYVTRGQLYRTQLIALDDAMQMGECFFTGHLLDGARLTRKDKVMIKTKAGSDLEVDVTNAMVELAPELEGEPGFPIGSSEPNVAARQGEEFLVQRPEPSTGRFVKKEVNAVEFDQPFMEDNVEMDDDASITFDAFDEMDPPELVQAAHEAFALQHKAKQRIMEVRKLRQYYRRPDQDERRRSIQEKMKTSPCHRCGEFGHWSRECLQKHNAAAAVSGPKSGPNVKGNVEDDWATLVSLCHQQSTGSASSPPQYKERFIGVVNQMNMIPHETLWCQKELRLNVILDLGCVKSVVGVEWMNNLLEEWKARKRWFRIQPES